jgi:hypothetical protein
MSNVEALEVLEFFIHEKENHHHRPFIPLSGVGLNKQLYKKDEIIKSSRIWVFLLQSGPSGHINLPRMPKKLEEPITASVYLLL